MSEISSAVVLVSFTSTYRIVSIFVTTLPTASSTESDSNPNLTGSIVTPKVSVEYFLTYVIISALISSISAEKLSSSPSPTLSINTLTTESNANSKALPSTTTPDSSAAAAKEFTVAINLLLLS
ncbi:Uncharacterised protein [marine metagenome]